MPIILLTGQKKDEIDKVLGLGLGRRRLYDQAVRPKGAPGPHPSRAPARARPRALGRGIRLRRCPDQFQGENASSKKGKDLVLTAKEYGLLELLVRHEGEVVSRETILNEVWGYETFPTTRTIDTFVHALRRKIEKDPARPVHLLTVPWMGYKFKK